MSKASLVEAVKSLQRSDPDLKQAWWDYCDKEFQGNKDPNRHDEDSLQNFLSQYGQAEPARPPRPTMSVPMGRPVGKGGGGGPWGGGKGMRPMVMPMVPMSGFGQAGPSDLAGFVKLGQRQSSSFKEAWQTYCGMYGGGINDPGRHEPTYVTGFIDYLGQLAQADLGAAAAQMMQMHHMGPVGGGGMGMSRKRPVDTGRSFGEPPRKKGGGMGGNDSDKAALVDRVKALQRRDADTKQAWWSFTDEHHGGIHDPNRHDKDTLLQFLSQYE